MPAEEPRRRGRPVSGRKKVFQAAFEPDDAKAIEKLATKTGRAISAVVRDLALEGLHKRGKS